MSTAAVTTVTTVTVHAGRNLRGWSRTPGILVQSIGMPVGMLVVITFMFGNAIEMATGQPAIQGLVPLMMSTGPMFAGASSAAGLVTERQEGLLQRFRTLPGPVAAPLVGRVLAETLRGTVAAALILAVGFAMGYRMGTSTVAGAVPGILGILGLVALVALAFSSMLTWVGMIAKTPEATVAALPVMMSLLFFNTGFMPADGFPGYMRGFVEANPLSAAVQAMNACAGHGGSVVPALLWLGGITVLGIVLLAVAARRPR